MRVHEVSVSRRFFRELWRRHGALGGKRLAARERYADWVGGEHSGRANRAMSTSRFQRDVLCREKIGGTSHHPEFRSIKIASSTPFSNPPGAKDSAFLNSERYHRCMKFLRTWDIPPFPVDSNAKSESLHGWPLLLRALTHASALPAHLNPRQSGVLTDEQRWERYQLHNAALEFVGDRVLNLCVLDWLICTQMWRSEHASSTVPRGTKPEEMLSHVLQLYIYNANLSEVACRIGLDQLVRRRLPYENHRMDRGAELVLANAFEALVCAIFLEHGFDHAQKFVKQTLLQNSITSDAHAPDSEPFPQTGDVLNEGTTMRSAAPVLSAPWRKPLSIHPKEALEKELLLWGLNIRECPNPEVAGSTVPGARAEKPSVRISYRLDHEEQRLSHKSVYVVHLELSGYTVARGRGRAIRNAENAAAAAFLGMLGLDCDSFRVQHAHGDTLSSQLIWEHLTQLGVPLSFPDDWSESCSVEGDAKWTSALLWNRQRIWSAVEKQNFAIRSNESKLESAKARIWPWLGVSSTGNADLMEHLRSILAVTLPGISGASSDCRQILKHIIPVELRFLGHWCLKLHAASNSLQVYGPAATSSAALHDHYVRSIATAAISKRAACFMKRLQDAHVWPKEAVLAPFEQREMFLSFLGIAQVLYGYDAGPASLLQMLQDGNTAAD